MRGNRRRGRGIDPYIMLLAMRLLQQIQQLPYKPPVTLALMGGMTAIHLGLVPAFPSLCLTPATFVAHPFSGDSLAQLVVPALLHADDYHLYYNLSSLLWKGVQLEHLMGSEGFAALLGFFVVASSALFLVLSSLTGWSFAACTVGFSGVLFALKMVLNAENPGDTVVYGFRVPTRHAAWLELVLISVFMPQASAVR